MPVVACFLHTITPPWTLLSVHYVEYVGATALLTSPSAREHIYIITCVCGEYVGDDTVEAEGSGLFLPIW